MNLLNRYKQASSTVEEGSPMKFHRINVTCVKKVLVAKSYLTLCHPWTVALQAPLSMEFFRQEYWSGQPFPSPGDLPDPGTELRSPALWAISLTSGPPGKPWSLSSVFIYTCESRYENVQIPAPILGRFVNVAFHICNSFHFCFPKIIYQ